MKSFPRRARRLLILGLSFGLPFGLLSAGARPAMAQVTEPNGVNVPALLSNGEITLQSYFTSQGEAIDAVANAAADPGVFLPLCDFAATLVLNQSQGQAGIAWYNVPTNSPTVAPTAVYLIVPAGTPVGQAVTSADVRNDPNYLNGLIGFALMRDGAPVYYSEYQRNVYCSGCAMPGYWKMALAYQSKLMANTYYLAFEDWPGADTRSWQGNDGDFNDKVFRISGVTCNGGGTPCDTGKLGVCSTGMTECQPGGTLACKQQVQPAAEKCDNLDNDCNGQIDDGPDLCPTGYTCVQGTCIPPCGRTEFDCTGGYVCDNGLCIDPACIGKTCPAGQVCRGGACVGGCDGVKCPIGQDCQLGVCVDLCAGVQCPAAVCERGVCVTYCRCRTCAAGQVCDDASGHCVDDGCAGMTCPAGQACRGGACVDSCATAMCPGGAQCHTGVCDMPMTGRPNFIDGGVVPPTGGTGGGTTATGGSGGGTTRDAGADATVTGGAPSSGDPRTSGCCVGVNSKSNGSAAFLMLALLVRRRRRS